MILLLAFAFVLLAALLTLPLGKNSGAGRVAAFAVLSLVGAAASVFLVHEGIVPTLTDGSSDESSEAEEKTLDEMKEAIEAEVMLELVASPSAESLKGDHPTVWRFEQDYTLLCAARDFPDTKVLDCWAPDGAIGADPLGEADPSDPSDMEDMDELDLEDFEELEGDEG